VGLNLPSAKSTRLPSTVFPNCMMEEEQIHDKEF